MQSILRVYVFCAVFTQPLPYFKTTKVAISLLVAIATLILTAIAITGAKTIIKLKAIKATRLIHSNNDERNEENGGILV